MKKLFFLLVAMVSISLPAHAILKIDITSGSAEPLPIAIVAQPGMGAAVSRVAQNIQTVVNNNLIRSGLFRTINENAYIEKPENMVALPRFADWKLINADALVTLKPTVMASGDVRVEFRLWDTVREQQLIGRYYSAPQGVWRRIAHIISDDIYQRLTGDTGYFDTQIVYISETGSNKGKTTRLAIMDQDGENHRFLTEGQNLVLGPRFSPKEQQITYLSYFNNTPRAYLFNIETGEQEPVGDFPGMTISPRFSPDGNKIVLSAKMESNLGKEGGFEIYSMDLRTRITNRLTNNTWMDISPSFSPSGKQIAYNSKKPGCPMLYVMNSDGSDPKRISYHKENGKQLRCGAIYTTPVWSPRGDLIAFTKQYKGQFYIGVMRTDGSKERLLAHPQMPDSFHAEGPTWSPNGRIIMFYRKDPVRADGSGGISRLYSIDLTGRSFRQVVTPLEGSDPAWSPLRTVK